MDKDRIGARTQQPLDQIGRLEWSELTTNSNLYCSRDWAKNEGQKATIIKERQKQKLL
jgi:hypothetical protein